MTSYYDWIRRKRKTLCRLIIKNNEQILNKQIGCTNKNGRKSTWVPETTDIDVNNWITKKN